MKAVDIWGGQHGVQKNMPLAPFKTAVSYFPEQKYGKGKSLRFRLVGQF